MSPPLVIQQPANSKVSIFGQVTFQCTVQAVGETAVIWKKDQSPLPVTATINNITSLNEVTSVLKITGVSIEDYTTALQKIKLGKPLQDMQDYLYKV